MSQPRRLRGLRLRQPLLRGDRRVHPLRRARHGEAHHAVGRDRRQAAPARRRQGQPVHPEPHLGPDLQAGRARRVLPRPQPQGRGRARALRRPRPAERPPRVPRPRRPPEAHGRAGHERRDLPPHPRRRHGAGAARRPARAARRLPRLQPVAGGGLGLRLPGAHLRRADAHVRRPRRGAEVGAVGARPRRPLLRARPRTGDHALGPGVAGRPGVRPGVGPAQRVGRGAHRARRQRLLHPLPRRLGRGHRDGGVPPEPVPFHRVVERGAGLVRQPARARAVPALPEPAHGVDRDRLRLGVPPLRQAEEVVLADPVAATPRTRARPSGATCGCRRTTRTTSPVSATSSVPTTC